MKKETLKEFGKYLTDTSKIIITIAIIAPVVKSESISFIAITLAIVLSAVGFYFFNKGAKDE